MNTEALVERAVKEFAEKGVNLIFGHGNEYAAYFNQLSSEYPDIHFVSFNGDAREDNTSSFSFEGYAMGFFGGMTAAHMSSTKKISVIAAYEWQPEAEGFYEGAVFQDPDIEAKLEYVGHWDDEDIALKILDKLIAEGHDVIYPAGDGYNIPVIERIKEEGLYAIGYVSDQADLGQSTVLTSTVQHVDMLYGLVAREFNEGNLKSGNVDVDFQDEVISLGKFSPLVDHEFKQKIREYIMEYKESGKMPYETERE
jgi:transcriptional activator of comK gene